MNFVIYIRQYYEIMIKANHLTTFIIDLVLYFYMHMHKMESVVKKKLYPHYLQVRLRPHVILSYCKIRINVQFMEAPLLLCLPQRLKSTFFQTFFRYNDSRSLQSEEIFSKNIEFGHYVALFFQFKSTMCLLNTLHYFFEVLARPLFIVIIGKA